MYRFMNYGYLFMDISFNTQTSPAYQQKIQTCAMIDLDFLPHFDTASHPFGANHLNS